MPILSEQDDFEDIVIFNGPTIKPRKINIVQNPENPRRDV